MNRFLITLAFCMTFIGAASADWRVSEDVDALTDEKNVFLFAISEDNKKARLYVSCTVPKSLTVGLVLGGSDRFESRYVKVRWDKEPASDASWRIRGDNEQILSPESEKDFVGKLLQHNKFIIRYYLYFSGSATDIFDVSGLDKKLHMVEEACDVKLR